MGRVDANDLDPKAVESMQRNIAFNGPQVRMAGRNWRGSAMDLGGGALHRGAHHMCRWVNQFVESHPAQGVVWWGGAEGEWTVGSCCRSSSRMTRIARMTLLLTLIPASTPIADCHSCPPPPFPDCHSCPLPCC